MTDTPKSAPEEDVSVPTPDSDTPSTPTNPYLDPDMPGGVPLVPGHPDTPVPPMTEDDVSEDWNEESPLDPEGPMLNDRSANPGIAPKEPSPDSNDPAN